MPRIKTILAQSLCTLLAPTLLLSAPIAITQDGKTDAVIVVEKGAEEASGVTRVRNRNVHNPRHFEWSAANDLALYIEKMSGAKPEILTDEAAIAAALKGDKPVFVIGELGLKTNPALKKELAAKVSATKTKLFAPDVIVTKRDNNKIYLVGSNDRSHYYATSHLLHSLGCRWYMPTEFGEVVPEKPTIEIGELNVTYAPPFEVRYYWNGWNGSMTGFVEYQARNFFNPKNRVPSSHILNKYTKEIIPEGGRHFNIPITDPATALHVANQIGEAFEKGQSLSMSMEDGVYKSAYEGDALAVANVWDKYFQTASMTDAFWIFYNNLANILTERYPKSAGKIGFLAYTNITIPPQRDIKANPALMCYLAPIDIDPNHHLEDPRSPSREEFGEMVRRWSEVMDGRVAIYDYDQAMLVWRDLPNPSHHIFAKDVKFYQKAGIMGVDTESRGALGTIFTNMFFRGQLLWNPDQDVNAMLDEFYKGFYGPLEAPMRDYWNAIYQAWEQTWVSEHEYYTIPAIYTPELVETLRKHLATAEKLAAPLQAKGEDALSTREKLYLRRLDFTRKSFNIIDHYLATIAAVWTEGDYAKGVEHGQKALASVQSLAEMGSIFATGIISKKRPEYTMSQTDAAWMPGEINQYNQLLERTNGTTGKLITHLPKEWAFRRDPNDTGLPRGFARKEADLSFWEKNKANYPTPQERKDYPTTEWETVRTDLYPQAQGILHPDNQSFTGFMWYKTSVDLTKAQTEGKVHLHFPGLFSETWLYVNGYLVAHRRQNHMWWKNSYRFDWDVDVSGLLKPGKNDITLRIANTHHNGGIFRRPFLYHSFKKEEAPAKPAANTTQTAPGGAAQTVK